MPKNVYLQTDTAPANWKRGWPKPATGPSETGSVSRYAVFKPGNPIHDILSIESSVFSPRQSAEAYRILEKIFIALKGRIRPGMSAEDKLKMFFEVLEKDFHFDLKEQTTDPLLTSNLIRGGLDCDSSLMILLACAHELNWPVKLADNLMGHIFARWDDGRTRINVSYGELYTDEFYKQNFNVSKFSTLDSDGIRAVTYSNRGIYKSRMRNYAGALQDYGLALKLNPKEALTFHNQGVAHYHLGNYGRAVESFNRVISLRPDYAASYKARGAAEQKRGDQVAAQANFEEALRLSRE